MRAVERGSDRIDVVEVPPPPGTQSRDGTGSNRFAGAGTMDRDDIASIRASSARRFASASVLLFKLSREPPFLGGQTEIAVARQRPKDARQCRDDCAHHDVAEPAIQSRLHEVSGYQRAAAAREPQFPQQRDHCGSPTTRSGVRARRRGFRAIGTATSRLPADQIVPD
jgi:hypothetical protein